MSIPTYDVAILGSGFGATLLATMLARRGKSVAIFDPTPHPRFTIGESSTPVADKFLSRIAAQYDISELQPLSRYGTWRATHPEHNCGCKRGFTYFWHGTGNEFCPTTDHQYELLATANASEEVADTQWYRPQFDLFLVNISQQYGVTLKIGFEVRHIEHVSKNSWRLLLSEGECHARFLVDASGGKSLLLNALDIPEMTDQLLTQSYSLYSHWDHCPPLQNWCRQTGVQTNDFPYPVDQSVIHHLFDTGWLWQIRFADGLMSLGFVFQGDPATSELTPEQQWSELLKRYPVLTNIVDGIQLSNFPGRLFSTGQLQRLRSQAAGEDWAALPFTVGFVDPLHSTGIAHTLSAIDRLATILTAEETEQPKKLEAYSRQIIEEIRHIDRLVYGCYQSLSHFEMFTAWTMCYFAAATTYERHLDENNPNKVGFLCAQDDAFHQMISARLNDLQSLVEVSSSRNPNVIDSWIKSVEQSLQPYNHVGLFHPAIPNMYTHTSAEK